jgi:hypothetical protein
VTSATSEPPTPPQALRALYLLVRYCSEAHLATIEQGHST